MFPRITNSPEALTGKEETVKSVRLVKRARKTPERPLRPLRKELIAVKEWSEFGRRGGGAREGQLRNEREVREDERALKAVEERIRSEEQFAKESEVTSLNGEVEEQVTVMEEPEEERRWLVHGSLTVGMLRDSRARSCFGSSGEEEEFEDGFVIGDLVGDETGERDGFGIGDGTGERDGFGIGVGVGERDGAAEMVVVRRRRRSNGCFMVETEEREREKKEVSEEEEEEVRKIGFFKDGSCDSWVFYILVFKFNLITILTLLDFCGYVFYQVFLPFEHLLALTS